jgi:peroxiredoxin
VNGIGRRLALSLTVIRTACWLGLWGAATWCILSLHDTPIAGEHSICGPWGCGPTIPALLSTHGFWLMVAIPGSLWAGKWMTSRTSVAVGWVCLALGMSGVARVSLGELMNWRGATHPEARSYTTQRVLFALATTVEVPLIPGIIAGLILLNAGRRPSRGPAPTELPSPIEPNDDCTSDYCGLPASGNVLQVTSRIEVGKPLTALTLVRHDGLDFVVPTVADERALVLYFMRDAGCSICRKHVRTLARIFERLCALGTQVIVVQPGGNEASRALADSESIPFTIASGRDSRAYDAIGLPARSFGLLQGCGTLLVDGRGVVRYARLASLPFAAFSESELLDALHWLGTEKANASPESPLA